MFGLASRCVWRRLALDAARGRSEGCCPRLAGGPAGSQLQRTLVRHVERKDCALIVKPDRFASRGGLHNAAFEFLARLLRLALFPGRLGLLLNLIENRSDPADERGGAGGGRRPGRTGGPAGRGADPGRVHGGVLGGRGRVSAGREPLPHLCGRDGLSRVLPGRTRHVPPSAGAGRIGRADRTHRQWGPAVRLQDRAGLRAARGAETPRGASQAGDGKLTGSAWRGSELVVIGKLLGRWNELLGGCCPPSAGDVAGSQLQGAPGRHVGRKNRALIGGRDGFPRRVGSRGAVFRFLTPFPPFLGAT